MIGEPWAISWSSGKDSAFALWIASKAWGFPPKVGFTTFSENEDQVSMHGTAKEIVREQALQMNLELIEIPLPNPCPNEIYEKKMSELQQTLLDKEIKNIVFGDLFLEDIRTYREAHLTEIGIQPYFPLWKNDTGELAEFFLKSGFKAKVASVDLKKLPKEFCGRDFDSQFLKDLPQGTDPCGEYGEFHTIVTEAPYFTHPIDLIQGETVEKDGFAYTPFRLA